MYLVTFLDAHMCDEVDSKQLNYIDNLRTDVTLSYNIIVVIIA